MASLNREEWKKMWESITRIEEAHYADHWPLPHSGHRRAVRIAIDRIKKQIQQVIGQME